MNRPFVPSLAALLALFCTQCKRQDDFLLLPLLAPGQRLEVSFNGRFLADEPGPEPEANLDDVPRNTPTLHDGCLLSHPRGLYALERGLKFRLCTTETSAVQTAVSTGASLDEGRFELREYTKAELSSAFDSPLVVLRSREQNLSIRTQREILTGSVSESDIPASFPCCMPALVVEQDSLSFLYAIDSRFLVLRIHDESIAKRFKEALQRTEDLTQDSADKIADVFVSEIYFSSQGSPFVELSSDSDGLAEAVLVSDLGERAELRGQIFAGAAVLVPIAFKSRIDLTTKAGTATILESSQAAGAGKSHSRTADFPGQRGSLLPSIRCGEEGPQPACHSRGIGPAYLNSVQKDQDRFCQPEDIALRELNPFGFESNGSLNPAGKFAEFELLRDCESGRIMFYAPLEIDPGNRKLTRGQRLVIAADSQFFSEEVLENSRMRSLSPDRPIQILSLEDRNYRTQFAGFPPEDLWIPRAAGRIHSLILEDGRILFHGPHAAGLRPDVTAAMSPGFSLSSSEGSVRLNELYPTGSYHTASIPGDEFFETRGQAGAGMFTLEVLRLRDSKKVAHRFPATNGLTAYFAQTPVCFDAPYTRAALFLPNEAARYTLLDSNRQILDEVEIGTSLYSAMEKDRRSLGSPWVLSAQGGRCLRSAASPGMENEAAP